MSDPIKSAAEAIANEPRIREALKTLWPWNAQDEIESIIRAKLEAAVPARACAEHGDFSPEQAKSWNDCRNAFLGGEQ